MLCLHFTLVVEFRVEMKNKRRRQGFCLISMCRLHDQLLTILKFHQHI